MYSTEIFDNNSSALYLNTGEFIGTYNSFDAAVAVAIKKKASIFKIKTGKQVIKCCVGTVLHPFTALFSQSFFYVLVIYRLLLKSKTLFIKGQGFPLPADCYDIVFDEKGHTRYCRDLN